MNPRAKLGQISDADLRLLRVFQAVVRSGGLTAAEPELNIGRSTISRHLKDLEIRLGVTLCQRGRSGFALTEEGARIYEASGRLLMALDRFRNEVGEINERLQGNLRVAIFDKTVTNPEAKIAEAFRYFEMQAPAVSLELHVEPTHRIEAGVNEGAFHLGIIPTHRESSAFEYTKLFEEPVYLYCGRYHPLFDKLDRPGAEAIVGAQKYVGMGFHSPNMKAAKRLNLIRQAEAYDQEAVAMLILSGRYIGFLPQHYAEPFVDRRLIRELYPEHFHYNCEFAAIAKRAEKQPRIPAIFLSCLRRAHNPGSQ